MFYSSFWNLPSTFLLFLSVCFFTGSLHMRTQAALRVWAVMLSCTSSRSGSFYPCHRLPQLPRFQPAFIYAWPCSLCWWKRLTAVKIKVAGWKTFKLALMEVLADFSGMYLNVQYDKLQLNHIKDAQKLFTGRIWVPEAKQPALLWIQVHVRADALSNPLPCIQMVPFSVLPLPEPLREQQEIICGKIQKGRVGVENDVGRSSDKWERNFKCSYRWFSALRSHSLCILHRSSVGSFSHFTYKIS